MRHSYLYREKWLMQVLIGFVIALMVGLTGVGGGSFTTPALVLLVGISGAEAVGTALVFSTAVRLIAAPFYISGKQVHLQYLGLMLLGAIPGVLGGTYLLRSVTARLSTPLVLVVIGVILISSSLFTLMRRRSPDSPGQKPASWLAWIGLPIGIETGFSSAGAGALGTVLLFNFSGLTAAEVIGTDLVFGIALASLGALLHFTFGTISGTVLKALLCGGIPGVLLGCVLARHVPSHSLRKAILLLTLIIGLQLIVAGARSLL
ncbi:MAG: hypothetical protein DMG65_14045 [Candidatus Angelobacter sp. Gp1-AA117]|nr:MAG: hypothetical protein DMG65_14045 [Candidatus Angelobacter sp. Gp1-AA117]